MKSRFPTSKEMAELVSFLPGLTMEGFSPIKSWRSESSGGTMVWPTPEYEELVEEFFRVASREYWNDYQYTPDIAEEMLHDADTVRTADLAAIKTMLTYCVRGERFSEGHWGATIEKGHLERLLNRIAEIQRESD